MQKKEKITSTQYNSAIETLNCFSLTTDFIQGRMEHLSRTFKNKKRFFSQGKIEYGSKN